MSNLSTIFTNIANSIRNKAKITNTMLPSEMPYYIEGISSGTQNIKISEAGKGVCNIDITITITEV